MDTNRRPVTRGYYSTTTRLWGRGVQPLVPLLDTALDHVATHPSRNTSSHYLIFPLDRTSLFNANLRRQSVLLFLRQLARPNNQCF